jgi:hypothetical protein
MSNKKKIIEKALAECETNGEYLAKNISGPDLAYLRTWASRKGYSVTKQGLDAFVSIKKNNKVRAQLKQLIAAGKQFSFEHPNGQYIRTIVSEINKNSVIKWKVSETQMKELFICYPDPVSEALLNKNDLI